MKRYLFALVLVLIALCCGANVFAGGAINKSNLSSDLFATPSNARTKLADIGAYNPAGTVKMDEGLSMYLSSQFLFEKRYNNVFEDRSSGSKDHETTKGSVIPSLYGVYNFGSLALFGGLNVPVGGGKINYKEGNLTTYQLGQSIAARTSGALPGSFYKLDKHSVEANHFGLNLFTGAAIRPSDWFSVSGALRYINADLEMDGHVGVSDAFGRFPSFGHGVKFDANATGFGGVFGLDLFPNDDLTIGLRYETRVKLDYEFDIEKDSAGILPGLGITDGGKKRDDLPATLAFGVGYNLSENWTAMMDANWYMNTRSELGGTSLRDNIDGESLDEHIKDSYEIGLGVQYAYEAWTFNVGYIYSNMGVPAEYSSKFLPDLDAHTVALGVGWNPWKTLQLSLGFGNVFYVSDSYIDNTLGDPRLGPYAQPNMYVEFEKNVLFGGLSAQYTF